LNANGLVLRGMAGYGLPDALRLTIGSQEANEKVVAVLSRFMKEQDGA